MDQLLKTLSEIKKTFEYRGTVTRFKGAAELVVACRKLGVIAIVIPSDIHRNSRDDYFAHLCALTKKYLFANPEQKYWEQFVNDPGNKKIHKILQEFGVRQELFSDNKEEVYSPLVPSNKRLTLEEFYEVCQIQFNFEGSLAAFKRHIARTYGSFAEYCIMKGYDINNTNWESPETATRVAEKLGSIEEIKKKSASLFKYLQENDLLSDLDLRTG